MGTTLVGGVHLDLLQHRFQGFVLFRRLALQRSEELHGLRTRNRLLVLQWVLVSRFWLGYSKRGKQSNDQNQNLRLK